MLVDELTPKCQHKIGSIFSENNSSNKLTISNIYIECGRHLTIQISIFNERSSFYLIEKDDYKPKNGIKKMFGDKPRAINK